MDETNKRPSDAKLTKRVRRSLGRAGVGDTASAGRLQQEEHAHPESAEAGEQVASDGPGERGLSR